VSFVPFSEVCGGEFEKVLAVFNPKLIAVGCVEPLLRARGWAEAELTLVGVAEIWLFIVIVNG